MQLEVIGVGGAGCRIADAIRAWDTETTTSQSFVNEAFAFDTDTDGLTELTAIPDANRHRYGETVSQGLNGNLHRGFEVGSEHVDELSRTLDEGRPAVADGFLVVVGFGGATGGGTAPALVANLQRLYDEPVYVLATLPADRELGADDEERVELEFADESTAGSGAGGGNESDESDENDENDENEDAADPAEPDARPLADENAVRTLERLDGLADAIVCFDNEEWLKTGESLADGRERLNREFATRAGTFFAATADTSDAAGTTAGPDAETIVDANDVGRILGSTSAVVTIGYGEQRVDADGDGGVLGLGVGPDLGPDVFGSDANVDTGAAYSAVETAIQKGLHGKATLECDRANAERAMVIVGGPPEWLNRQAMADGRRTVESATDSADILGGDAPRPGGDTVFAVVVLAAVEPVDRLEELRAATRESRSHE